MTHEGDQSASTGGGQRLFGSIHSKRSLWKTFRKYLIFWLQQELKVSLIHLKNIEKQYIYLNSQNLKIF